ncbi:hypothetical protein HPC49_03425 [Pyxidicoccus fallax]|uniref:Uncharacterized protein n=1 Tax=Pyxidicoccus fallax TaxID=394095 RepID=A0A848LA61_9BACT|nr:hypothetical protein [Pyxidicoccus fallax]NMO15769.1 hypothetical protein [Pyxidicoccus fallax]NPC77307.1 hypothetical protein [Pyxidicoccus fallax]
MAMIIGLLSVLISLASLIFFIMVLIKLFQAKGPLHGILGIFCGIYTFIWGWMNVDANDNRQIMLAWTGCIVGSIVLNILGAVAGG